MFLEKARAKRAFRLLPVALAAALIAPLFSAPVLAGCCLAAKSCCPERIGATGPSPRHPAPANLSGPVPPCCQTLLPAAPPACGRTGVTSAPVAMALPSQAVAPEAALPSAGRVASKALARYEGSPAGSDSARAPPVR